MCIILARPYKVYFAFTKYECSSIMYLLRCNGTVPLLLLMRAPINNMTIMPSPNVPNFALLIVRGTSLHPINHFHQARIFLCTSASRVFVSVPQHWFNVIAIFVLRTREFEDPAHS